MKLMLLKPEGRGEGHRKATVCDTLFGYMYY